MPEVVLLQAIFLRNQMPRLKTYGAKVTVRLEGTKLHLSSSHGVHLVLLKLVLAHFLLTIHFED